MIKNKKDKCAVCGKDSNVRTGWHLEYSNGKILNLCSNSCVAVWVETIMSKMLWKLQEQEKRISKLERKYHDKKQKR